MVLSYVLAEQVFGPSLMVLNASGCPAQFTGQSQLYRSTCLDLLDSKSRQEGLELEVSSCTWKPYSAWPWYFEASHAKGYPLGKHANPLKQPYDGAHAQMCTSSSNTSEPWIMFRVGPFETYGGYDWSSINVFPFDVVKTDAAHLAQNGALPVVEWFVGSTSPKGRLLGYPPLHQHHFHLESLARVDPLNSDPAQGVIGLWPSLVAHGDDQCMASSGGVACLIRRLPNRHAQYISMPFLLFADTNDVRPLGSSPLQHYFTLAMRIKPHCSPDLPECSPYSHVKVPLYPRPPGPRRDIFYAFTYPIAAPKISVFYTEGRFVRDDEVLWSYLHTHAAWTAELLFFVGATAEQLNLPDLLSVGNNHLRDNIRPEELRMIRRELAARIRKTGAERVCHFSRHHSAWEEIKGTLEMSDIFYRKNIICKPFTTVANQSAVAFVVHAANGLQAATANMAPMHSIMRFFISRTAQSDAVIIDHDFIQWKDPEGGAVGYNTIYNVDPTILFTTFRKPLAMISDYFMSARLKAAEKMQQSLGTFATRLSWPFDR
mmetsp:Transcript_3891/g.6478  ORF Transcript_3891/g.6478 Transcript_3891/m.6478 type:complete len:544 (+) Transcript_3891:117-1748(+)